jgi:hypothetical protein
MEFAGTEHHETDDQWRRPQAHALEGAIFVGSLAIVWLGASLAH